MEFYLSVALHAQQWEKAKGELRALIALKGSYSVDHEADVQPYKQLENMVDAFIKEVEDAGHHEAF